MIKKRAFPFLLINLAKLTSWTLMILLLISGCIRIGQTISHTVNELPPNLGKILINVANSKQFIEFELSEGRLVRTNEGKSYKAIIYKEGREYFQMHRESDFFKTAYTNMDWRYEEKLRSVLSQYDLNALEALYAKIVLNKEKMGSGKYFLTGPSRIPQSLSYYGYSSRFLPNRQFSYVIYRDFFLINLLTGEITFPFGYDAGSFKWSLDRRYLAYEGKSTNRRLYLVIKDIFENRTLFEEYIDRHIAGLAWSPDFGNIAILTARTKLDAFIGTMAHFAPYTNNFYLQIYDMSGKELYRDTVIENFKDSGGRIVWLPNGMQ